MQGEIEYESVVEKIREYMKVEARLPSSKTVNEVYVDTWSTWGKGHDKGKGFEKGKGLEKGKSNWPDKSKGKGVQKTEAEFEWRTCHNCGKVGHLIRECYHLGTTDRNRSWTRNDWISDFPGSRNTWISNWNQMSRRKGKEKGRAKGRGKGKSKSNPSSKSKDGIESTSTQKMEDGKQGNEVSEEEVKPKEVAQVSREARCEDQGHEGLEDVTKATSSAESVRMVGRDLIKEVELQCRNVKITRKERMKRSCTIFRIVADEMARSESYDQFTDEVLGGDTSLKYRTFGWIFENEKRFCTWLAHRTKSGKHGVLQDMNLHRLGRYVRMRQEQEIGSPESRMGDDDAVRRNNDIPTEGKMKWWKTRKGTKFVIDTGACVSLIRECECVRNNLTVTPTTRKIRDVSGRSIEVVGQVEVEVNVPVERNGKNFGFGKKLCEMIVVADDVAELNILSLTELEELNLKFGKTSKLMFPDGWYHTVRTDLRDLVLNVEIRVPKKEQRSLQANDKLETKEEFESRSSAYETSETTGNMRQIDTIFPGTNECQGSGSEIFFLDWRDIRAVREGGEWDSEIVQGVEDLQTNRHFPRARCENVSHRTSDVSGDSYEEARSEFEKNLPKYCWTAEQTAKEGIWVDRFKFETPDQTSCVKAMEQGMTLQFSRKADELREERLKKMLEQGSGVDSFQHAPDFEVVWDQEAIARQREKTVVNLSDEEDESSKVTGF